jgi:hypothetical protein
MTKLIHTGGHGSGDIRGCVDVSSHSQARRMRSYYDGVKDGSTDPNLRAGALTMQKALVTVQENLDEIGLALNDLGPRRRELVERIDGVVRSARHLRGGKRREDTAPRQMVVERSWMPAAPRDPSVGEHHVDAVSPIDLASQGRRQEIRYDVGVLDVEDAGAKEGVDLLFETFCAIYPMMMCIAVSGHYEPTLQVYRLPELGRAIG